MNGRATPEGTARYAARMALAQAAVPEHFRPGPDGLLLSSIGLGTYLGDPTPEVDARYAAAIGAALAGGCNVLDTAINYRFQRSERAVGAALRQAVEAGNLARDEVFISTKGGYVPFDSHWPQDPEGWIVETFIRPGVAQPEDFVESHCMTPAYLRHQIGQSRANLGLDCIDLYYVHNPEGQLPAVGREEFDRRLRLAFAALEEAVAEGEIACYGTATWTGYRQPSSAPDHLALEDVAALAREVGGPEHHFRAIQLPYNMGMTEAYGRPTQSVQGEALPPLEAARRLGLAVFGSASLLQSRLAGGLPEALRSQFAGCETDAQRALQFARSAPDLTSALAGMSQVEHVAENLQLAQVPPMEAQAVRALFTQKG